MTTDEILIVYGGTIGGCIVLYLMVVLISNAVTRR